MNAIRMIIPPVIIAIVFFTWPQIEFLFASPEAKLFHLWQKDVKALAKSETFQKNWKPIRAAELSVHNGNQKYWLKPVQTPFELTPYGEHKLEILLVPWINDGEYGAAITHHLIDIKTGNTVWELGRTYVIGSVGDVRDRVEKELTGEESAAPEQSTSEKTPENNSEGQ